MRIAVCLLVAGLATGCSLFSREGPVEPPARLVEFTAQFRPQRSWAMNLSSRGEHRLGLAPATDGTWLYAGGNGGQAVAANPVTGDARWLVNTGLALSAGPTVAQQLVIFGTQEGQVVALDAVTGAQRWIRPVGGEILARPAVGEQVVVVRTGDGRLLGLALATGEPLWSLSQSVPALSLRGNAPPVIAGQRVIVGFDNGRIGAYALSNGNTVWEIQLATPAGRSEVARLVDIQIAPQIDGSTVYVSGYRGVLAALDLNSGAVVWSRPFSSYSGFMLRGNAIIAVDQASQVVALPIGGSGPQLWINDQMRMRDLSAPVLAGNFIVVGDYQGYIHWLNASTGEFVARVRAGDDRIAGLLMIGNVLVAQTDTGFLTTWTANAN